MAKKTEELTTSTDELITSTDELITLTKELITLTDETATEEKRYNKEAIVDSKKFEAYRDFLEGNLVKGNVYSLSEVESIIKKHYR